MFINSIGAFNQSNKFNKQLNKANNKTAFCSYQDPLRKAASEIKASDFKSSDEYFAKLEEVLKNQLRKEAPPKEKGSFFDGAEYNPTSPENDYP